MEVILIPVARAIVFEPVLCFSPSAKATEDKMIQMILKMANGGGDLHVEFPLEIMSNQALLAAINRAHVVINDFQETVELGFADQFDLTTAEDHVVVVTPEEAVCAIKRWLAEDEPTEDESERGD
jgi:hypothetical protein